MGRKKKPFIDKKSAQTFRLVHRSQKDPLQADEESAQRVFVPIDTQSEVHSPTESKEEATATQKSAQNDYGIFFDDEYDYMQHMRSRTGRDYVPATGELIEKEKQKKSVKIHLPEDVLPSEREEDVGLLNKAAPIVGPQPDWDPDIVAALDEEECDEELDDDFIQKAGGQCLEEEEEEEGDEDEEEEDSDADSIGSLDWNRADDSKSHFTEYSMTSSVIKRNEGLTTLDQRFERLMEQYDENEIGALDMDDIEGADESANNLAVAQAIDEFIQQEEKAKNETLNIQPSESTKCTRAIDSDSEDDEKELVSLRVSRPDEKWDCESVLSTYSTLYNHPTKIKEPSSNSRRKKYEKEGDVNEEAESIPASAGALTERRKGETSEERKARKQATKEDRKARRVAKKTTKLAFKNEKKVQEKLAVGNQFKTVQIQ